MIYKPYSPLLLLSNVFQLQNHPFVFEWQTILDFREKDGFSTAYVNILELSLPYQFDKILSNRSRVHHRYSKILSARPMVVPTQKIMIFHELIDIDKNKDLLSIDSKSYFPKLHIN